ncbi:ribosomal protein L29 [Hamiltosporidium magnivora]|uniref:60S ribosomal protein L29 n=1 Tax=Hamiltosporidium magnivora TaxID=148818 RepID=A0A4Q9L6V2_9MICR|nr:ribosomal protein L29 [Hamiltosporidium magnivora]
MAKKKNHTNMNQNRKAHRNGIKKVPRNLPINDRILNPKFLKNEYFAKKYNNIGRQAFEEKLKIEK